MNKFEHQKLNRHWGASLLQYIKYGEVPRLELDSSVKLLQNVLFPHLSAKYAEIESIKLNLNEGKTQIIITAEGSELPINAYLRTPLEKHTTMSDVIDIEDYELKNNTPDVVERIDQWLSG
mgnify:CR=1 FL=1